jgi:hypothetical protein
MPSAPFFRALSTGPMRALASGHHLAVHPSGGAVLVGDYAREAYLYWDLARGRGEVLRPHPGLREVGFAADGSLLLVSHRALTSVDERTGEVRAARRTGGTAGLSASGAVWACLSPQGALEVRRVEGGALLGHARVDVAHPSRVAVSDDGRIAVVAGANELAAVDTSRGVVLWRRARLGPHAWLHLARGGDRVAQRGERTEILDLASGAVVRAGEARQMWVVGLGEDGTFLSGRGTLTLRDTSGGVVWELPPCAPVLASVQAAGCWWWSSYVGVQACDTRTGAPVHWLTPGEGVDQLGAGRCGIVAGGKGRAARWSDERWEPIPGEVRGVSPDGTRVLKEDHLLSLVDGTSVALADRVPLSAAWSPDGGRLAWFAAGALSVVDTTDGRRVATARLEGMKVQFAPGGDRVLVCGGRRADVGIVDATTLAPIAACAGEQGPPTAAALLGDTLVTLHGDSVVRSWEMPAGTLTREVRLEDEHLSCLQGEGSGRVAIGGTTAVWVVDLRDGTVRRGPTGVGHRVTAVRWLADGTLVTGGGDGSVLLWDPAALPVVTDRHPETALPRRRAPAPPTCAFVAAHDVAAVFVDVTIEELPDDPSDDDLCDAWGGDRVIPLGELLRALPFRDAAVATARTFGRTQGRSALVVWHAELDAEPGALFGEGGRFLGNFAGAPARAGGGAGGGA